jgi:thymidylate kinase
MLITFSGLDGAGKSTLINSLRTTLEKQNRPVAVYHMNKDIGIFAYLRFIRNWIMGGAVSPGTRVTLGANSSNKPLVQGGHRRLRKAASRLRYSILWNKPLRSFIYLIDLPIFIFYRLYIEKIKKQILIMDRYFYDSLVDVASDHMWFLVRFLARLIPTPSIPIYLDVSPEEAYARKGEYSVEYHRRRWTAYHRVFPWVPNTIVLVSDRDHRTTIRRLEKAVAESINA